jgi:hypothetical protein
MLFSRLCMSRLNYTAFIEPIGVKSIYMLH